MTLNDVKPDTIMKLTKNLDRLFKIEGCDPACHACHANIKLHQKFKLASTPNGDDVMLCEICTVADLIKANRTRQREITKYKKLYPGFSRLSQ